MPRHLLSFSFSLSFSLSLNLSLTGEVGVRTLFTGQRERKRERGRGERERERGRKRERELHACASWKCGRALSIPHSVSQSVSMCDCYINVSSISHSIHPHHHVGAEWVFGQLPLGCFLFCYKVRASFKFDLEKSWEVGRKICFDQYFERASSYV